MRCLPPVWLADDARPGLVRAGSPPASGGAQLLVLTVRCPPVWLADDTRLCLVGVGS
jgi:hypothetical protein